MPTIQLTRDAHGRYPYLVQEIQAVMHYPRDSEDQERSAARAMLIVDRAAKTGPEVVGIARELLAAGLSAAHAGTRDKMATRAQNAFVAADMLLNLLHDAQRGRKPVVEQAVSDVAEYLAKYQTAGGHSATVGTSKAKAAWGIYRPVLHFWAALRVLQEQVGPEALGLIMQREPRRAFAIAEDIRERAAAVFLDDGKGQVQLIDSRLAWHLPEDLTLPDLHRHHPST